jgi:protein TonB
MFNNYVEAKNRKFSRWAAALITTSVIIHIAAAGGYTIRSMWVVEKLQLPGSAAELSFAPPPPPPPPPASKKKAKPDPVKKKLIKVTETVQPEKDKPKMDEVEIIDPDDGVEGGVEGGDPLGMQGGVLDGLGNNAPPPPETPKVVPPTALNQYRTGGETQIQPPDEVKNQIRRDSRSRVVAAVRLCLDSGGRIDSIRVIKSSGYPAYDQKIQSKMRAWTYKPFRVNGKPHPVCTAVTFNYVQTN